MAVNESQARLTATESAKWIVVYKNGDQHYPGRRMVVKPREVKTFDHLLEEVTLKLSPSFGAVRNIFTPEGGTRVSSLTDLRPNGHYVASPNEPFRQLSKIRYLDIPVKSSSQSRVSLQPSTDKLGGASSRRLQTVPSRYRDATTDEIVVHVYKNGEAAPARTFQLNRMARRFWEQTLARIGEKLRIGRGVHKLYTVRGQLVRDPNRDLENGGQYVAAADNETFKLVNYGATPEPFKNVTRGDSRPKLAPEPCPHQLRRPEPPGLETPRLGGAAPPPPPAAGQRPPLPALRTSFPQLAERARRLRENMTARSQPHLDTDGGEQRKRQVSPVTAACSVESSTTNGESDSDEGPRCRQPGRRTRRRPFYLHPVREEARDQARDVGTQSPSDTSSACQFWDGPAPRDSVDVFLDSVPTVEDVELAEVSNSQSAPAVSPLPTATVELLDAMPPWYHDYRAPTPSRSAPSLRQEAGTPEFQRPLLVRRLAASPAGSFVSDGYSPLPERAVTPSTPAPETVERYPRCVLGVSSWCRHGSRAGSVCSRTVSEPRLHSRSGAASPRPASRRTNGAITPDTPELVMPPPCHMVLFLDKWGEREAAPVSCVASAPGELYRSPSTPGQLCRSPSTPEYTGPWYARLVPDGLFCAPVSRGESPAVLSDHSRTSVSSTSSSFSDSSQSGAEVTEPYVPAARVISTQTSAEGLPLAGLSTPPEQPAKVMSTQTSREQVAVRSDGVISTQTSETRPSPAPSGIISYSTPAATPPRKRNSSGRLRMPALCSHQPEVVSAESVPATATRTSPELAPQPPPRPSVVSRHQPPPPPSEVQPPSAGWEWDETPIRPADEDGWYGRQPWTPPEGPPPPSPPPRETWKRRRDPAPPTDLSDRPVWPATRTNSPEESAAASPDAGDAAAPAPTTVATPDIGRKLDDIAMLLRTLLLQGALAGQQGAGAAPAVQLTQEQLQGLLQAAGQSGTGDGGVQQPHQ